MKNESIVPFSYAAIDFIIDENLDIYFLEANDLADGLYVLETLRVYLISKFPRLVNTIFKNGLLLEFVDLFKKNYEVFSKGDRLKRVAIIYHNKYKKCVQRDELIQIKETFISEGIDCEIYLPEELSMKSGFLIDLKNSFVPQAIFRRTSKLPLFIDKQLIINDPRIRYATANKYVTYNIVKEYSKSHNVLIKQPQTVLVNDLSCALKAIEMFKKRFRSDILVIKPVWLWGGQGVVFTREVGDAKVKLKQFDKIIDPKFLNYFKPLLVQNFINSFKFQNFNNKYYIFEIRVFLFNLKIVGLIGRIPRYPFNPNKLIRHSLLCNISGGGKWLPILIDDCSNFKVKKIFDNKEIIFEEPINSQALILPHHFYVKISELSKHIVFAISEEAKKIDEEKLSSVPF